MNDFLAPFQILSVARFVKRHGIEVIHAHQRLPVFIGCLAGKIAGIPVVVTVHGQTQYDVRSPLVRRWIDKFIFVRQSTFDEAKGYGIPAEKSLLIQNGVRIVRFTRIKEIIIHYVISAASIKDILRSYPW